jgi:hypothetical protein
MVSLEICGGSGNRAERCSDIGASNLILAEVLGKPVVSMGSTQLLSDSAGLDTNYEDNGLHPRQKVLDAEQRYPLCSQLPVR